MPDLVALIQSGSENLWLFVPAAVLLGALHGLEPGHSKTMMAAFIIAIGGTVWQAVLLGLSATVSHTAVVWAIALAGMYFGSQWASAAMEPYLQLVSAVLIISVAAWMFWRTWRDQAVGGNSARKINTGHGIIALDILEDGVPPRWRIKCIRGDALTPGTVTLDTLRPDGSKQTFSFESRDGWLRSIEEIPEPHEFRAALRIAHGGHAHIYRLEFHEHDHAHPPAGLDVGSSSDAGAHERAHAEDIRRRFANRQASTAQIALFGLTGGLIPCPASITILLLCLQLKKIALGAGLVLCFSVGLALTMVTVGVAAALSVNQVAARWPGFGAIARRAPYASAVMILCVGLYTGSLAWAAL